MVIAYEIFSCVSTGQASLIDEQEQVCKGLSRENWCSVWAPDCSYVAWSQGAGIVYLLPWNRDAGKLYVPYFF